MMEKRNIHGALWSAADEEAKTIGFIPTEDLSERKEQADILRAYGVDELAYDEEELEELFCDGDTVLTVVAGVVTPRADT